MTRFNSCAAALIALATLACMSPVALGASDPNEPVPLPYDILLHLRSSDQGFLTQTSPPLYPTSFGGTFDISSWSTPQDDFNLLNFQTVDSYQLYSLGDVSSLSMFIVTKLIPSEVPQLQINSQCPGLFAIHATPQGWLQITTCEGDTPVVHNTQTVVSTNNGLTFFGVAGNPTDGIVTLYVNNTIATHRFSHTFPTTPTTTIRLGGAQAFGEILWSNFEYSYQYINALAVYYFTYYNNGPVNFVEPEIAISDPGDSSTAGPLDTNTGNAVPDTHGLEGCINGYTTSTSAECSCESFGCQRCLLREDEGEVPLCIECKANFAMHLQQCVTSCPTGFVERLSGGLSQCVLDDTTTTDPGNTDTNSSGSSKGAKTAMIIAIIMCVISLALLVGALVIYRRHKDGAASIKNVEGRGSFGTGSPGKKAQKNTIIKTLGGEVVKGRSFKSNATDWYLPSHNLDAGPSQFNSFASPQHTLARSLIEAHSIGNESYRSRATSRATSASYNYNNSDTSTLLDPSTYH